MKSEHNAAVAKFIKEHLETSAYSMGEIALLVGSQSIEVVEGFVRGDLRIPLDKALPLAQALGCDKRKLFVLVLTSWFGTEFVKTIEDVLVDGSASTAEQGWIDFLRGSFGNNVPELTPSLRRRLRLVASLPS
ncbi:hypothetical protein ASE23_20210 [Rhizobium sp. Root73]|uniref:hypothetical protein n=1 Tax=unclassified Rhizobium TaxID=2613769 RepID=UPI000728280A|nr:MULTISPECIES: hypothetical protein [unclassified Rhizobium]KQY16310.1 hypothetical protein ASD36_22885 [Rhizobium sp. Root1334]KRC12689.1 hypothetical protein ASE23_20210 [Rhizobium sp. Root73]